MSSFDFLQHNVANVPDASMMRFGIVVTEWNAHITEAMLKSAIDTLTEYGANETSITVRYVPGAFELVYGCAQLAEHWLCGRHHRPRLCDKRRYSSL